MLLVSSLCYCQLCQPYVAEKIYLQSGSPASIQRPFSLRILLMSFSQSDDHIKIDPKLRPLSQDGSFLARGRPQIPVEPAPFFSSVTETQHPKGPKSQRPEINGFARITWRTQEKNSGFLSPPVSLSTLCLFSCSSPKAQPPPAPNRLLFPDSEVQDKAVVLILHLQNSKRTESRNNKPQLFTPP